jgi:hypothetical protein
MANLDALVPAYWVCLIVGGGLVTLSVLAGAASGASLDTDVDFDLAPDVDFDADLDLSGADLDADALSAGDVDIATGVDADVLDAHHAVGGAGEAMTAAGSGVSLASWFSLRFVVFAAATFGFVGVVLTYLSDLGPAVTLAVAAIAGIAVGQVVHQIIRAIRRNSGNSSPTPADYVNQPGRVSIAIRHPHKGEIALSVRGTQRYIPAVTRREQTGFAIGDRAYVIAYRGGVAEVVTPKEYEFLTYKGRGAAS